MSLRPSGTSSGSKHSAAILGLKELPDDLRCSLEQVWLANRAATKLVMMRLHYHACRYFTPKEDGKFTALWFYVIPLDEHSTRVINHAVIVQPLPGIVKVRLLKVLLRSCLLYDQRYPGSLDSVSLWKVVCEPREGFRNSTLLSWARSSCTSVFLISCNID